MLSRSARRRVGGALAGLLLFQGLTTGVGLCAQTHAPEHVLTEEAPVAHGPSGHGVAAREGHPEAPVFGEGADARQHDVGCCALHAGGDALDGARGPEAPGSADCASLPGCAVPVLTVVGGPRLAEGVSETTAERPAVVVLPADVDLRITTPPPKAS